MGCLIIFLLFPLIDLVGVGIALLLPSVQAARESARIMTCTQNLKQIGLAMQGYHQKYGCFPPAFVADKQGKPKHSWRVLILPFLEEKDLYAKYRFDEPWNGPHNMALAVQMPKVYRCPSDYDDDRSRTSYAMIVGPHAVSNAPTSRRLSDIKENGTKTIMLAEAANSKIQWLEPRDLNVKDMTFRPDAGDPRGPSPEHHSDIASNHAVKIKVLLCDGTVHDVEKTLDEKSLKTMLNAD